MLVTGCVNMCYILLICHQSDSSNLSKYPTIMWFIAYLYVCVCMLSSVHSAITVHLMCLMFLPSSPDKSTTSESLFHDETHLVTWHKSHQPGLRAPLLAGRLWLLRGALHLVAPRCSPDPARPSWGSSLDHSSRNGSFSCCEGSLEHLGVLLRLK